MLRFLVYVVVVGVAIAASVWLADRPGSAVIEWLGWRLETTVPVLLAGVIAAAVIVVFVFRGLVSFLTWPTRWGEGRGEKRRRAGYQALSDGLAAALSGEAPKARKLAGRADKLLHDPTLTALLSAQAAKVSGDKDAAKQHFGAMLERSETALFGLKGLLEQALESGDDAEALSLAERGVAAAPADPWLADVAIKLMIKAGRLDQALASLTKATRKGGLTKAEAAHRRALIEDAQAEQAESDPNRAMALAKRALSSDPGHVPAALRLARLEAAQGKERRASATLERAWKARPTPEIAAAYTALHPGEDALARLRRLEALAAVRQTPVADLVLGEAALEAKLWGQARKHLLAAVGSEPGLRPYLLLARLEREEYANEAAAQAWMAKAAQSPPDAGWTCTHCNETASGWTLVCSRCGAVDSLAWSRPKPQPVATSNVAS